jgi:phytoene dehydrogenase-like protein
VKQGIVTDFLPTLILSFALATSTQAPGAVIRTNSPVAKILVHNGGTEGVQLENSEELRARAVLSNTEDKWNIRYRLVFHSFLV